MIAPMKFLWLLLSFRGRIGRAQFWLGQVLAAPFTAVGLALINWLRRGDWTPGIFGRTDIVDVVVDVVVVTIFFNFAVSTKRLHDRDTVGWWNLIILVPVVGPIWWLVEVGFLVGTRGTNRYGPDPRDPGA